MDTVENVLTLFEKETQKWFQDTLGEPTLVQKGGMAWHQSRKTCAGISAYRNGKTLSAFLVFLDQMKRQAEEGTLQQELCLIYVSPLKSLAADIRENLRRPLDGNWQRRRITVGDNRWHSDGRHTPQRDRQQMVKKPPHILIITPESLYLMLTSKTGQNVLATAKAVIIDELHALIDTKRGAHLMLSPRIVWIFSSAAHRYSGIGLSATR